MISNFELLSLPPHWNSLFSLPREKSNDIKEPSSRIDEIIFRIEYRLLPTNSPRETFSGQSWLTRIVQTTRGEAISTSHLPKIPLIFHPPIFKTKAFHPLILEARLEYEQRDEEAAINSPFLSLSLSRFGITRRSVEDSWHGRTGRQWHRVVLHHFWDRYLEAGRRERRHRAAKERTFRGDAA